MSGCLLPVGLEYTDVAVTCHFFLGSARLSGSDVVLVYEAAKKLFSPDPLLGEIDLRRLGVSLGRWQLAKPGSTCLNSALVQRGKPESAP